MVALKFAPLAAVCAVLADVLPPLTDSAEVIVVCGAAVGVLAQVWRKVLRPLVRGAESLIELANTAERRLEALEETVASLASLVDLARDESVADVRNLLRRGQLPQPPLPERRHDPR